MQILKGREQAIRELTGFIQNSMVSVPAECYRQCSHAPAHLPSHMLFIASPFYPRTYKHLGGSASYSHAHKHIVTTSCGREGRIL